MNNETRNMLLALMRGLTHTDGATQFDEGTPVIRGGDIQVLINAIKNVPTI